MYVGHILDEKMAADEMLKGRNIQLELNWEIWSKSSSKPFEIDVITRFEWLSAMWGLSNDK